VGHASPSKQRSMVIETWLIMANHLQALNIHDAKLGNDTRASMQPDEYRM